MLDLLFSYLWMTSVALLPCFINPRPTSTKTKKQKRKVLTESMFCFLTQEILHNLLNSGEYLALVTGNVSSVKKQSK